MSLYVSTVCDNFLHVTPKWQHDIRDHIIGFIKLIMS